jgi:hypothetical protein
MEIGQRRPRPVLVGGQVKILARCALENLAFSSL